MTQNESLLRLYRVLLVGGALFLSWRIVAVGLAQFYAEARDGKQYAKALAWYPDHPEALLQQARATMDTQAKETLLRRAYRENPANAEALMDLVEIGLARGETNRTDQEAALAERLEPANPTLRLRLADYWFKRNMPDKGIQQWDFALRIQPAWGVHLFPVMLRVAEIPEGIALFQRLAKPLPPWWQPFFSYAVKNAAHVETARALYALRSAAREPLSLGELNAYLERLMSEGFAAEAYLTWVNTLQPEQLRVLGYLYDGGFERASFAGAFDWDVYQGPGVQVEAVRTYGASGERALRLEIQGRLEARRLISQLLSLPVGGSYRLVGQVRPSQVAVAGGLQWSIYCLPSQKLLGSSERFLGSDDWRAFVAPFAVPEDDCANQRLDLHPVGPIYGETSSVIWFDGLAVERLKD